jgi:hypothetical protein
MLKLSTSVLAVFFFVVSNGCVNIGMNAAAYLCDTSSKTCYAHATICNSLFSIIASNLVVSGWTIVLPVSSYACSDYYSCTNVTRILAAPAASVTHTLPAVAYRLSTSNITFASIPSTLRATIATPVPSSTTGGACTVFIIAAPNITFRNIEFDSVACYTAVPTRTSAVLLDRSAAYLSIFNCVIRNVIAAIVVSYPMDIGILTVTSSTIQSPNTGAVSIYTWPLVAYIPANVRGSIVVSPPTGSSIVTESSSYAIQTQGVVVVDMTQFFRNLSNPTFSTTPTVSSSSSSSDGYFIATMVLIAAIGAVAIAILVWWLFEQLHRPPENEEQEQDVVARPAASLAQPVPLPPQMQMSTLGAMLAGAGPGPGHPKGE